MDQQASREPFSTWARRKPLNVALGALGALGAVLSLTPSPVARLYDKQGPDPGSRAVAVIAADDDVCWIADVGSGRPRRGCGDARIEVPAFAEGMAEEDAEMVGDYAGEFFVTVTKTFTDAVNTKPLRVSLEVDGDVAATGSTTLDRVVLDSVEED